MHPLVAKFRAIKIEQSSLLPSEDLDYCKELQIKLTKVYKQLDRWERYCKAWYEKEPNPAYSIQSYGNGEKYVSAPDKYRSTFKHGDNPFNRYLFTPAYNLVTIENLKYKALHFYVVSIYDYFNTKYGTDLKHPDISKTPAIDWTDYNNCIDDIRVKLGGHLDFNVVAIDKAIKAFKKEIYWDSRIEVKGKQIHIANYCYWGYSENPTFSDTRDDLQALNRAVSVYEEEKVVDDYALGSAIYNEPVDFTKDYPCINGTRLESVRFYKNRKIVLKFTDIQAANDFFNRLGLASFDDIRNN